MTLRGSGMHRYNCSKLHEPLYDRCPRCGAIGMALCYRITATGKRVRMAFKHKERNRVHNPKGVSNLDLETIR